MPKAVNLHAALVPLPSFIRRLFYVYFGFIAFILASFGLLTFLYAGPMAAGEPVARALCILMTVFWAIRLVVAALLFDMRPYMRTLFHRLGYFALNTVFIYLVVLYAYVAWKGGHA